MDTYPTFFKDLALDFDSHAQLQAALCAETDCLASTFVQRRWKLEGVEAKQPEQSSIWSSEIGNGYRSVDLDVSYLPRSPMPTITNCDIELYDGPFNARVDAELVSDRTFLLMFDGGKTTASGHVDGHTVGQLVMADYLFESFGFDTEYWPLYGLRNQSELSEDHKFFYYIECILAQIAESKIAATESTTDTVTAIVPQADTSPLEVAYSRVTLPRHSLERFAISAKTIVDLGFSSLTKTVAYEFTGSLPISRSKPKASLTLELIEHSETMSPEDANHLAQVVARTVVCTGKNLESELLSVIEHLPKSEFDEFFSS